MSKRYNLYWSFESPNVEFGSARNSIDAHLAYPIILPAAVPADAENVSLSSIVWYALVIVDPEALGNPWTLSILLKLPISNGMIVFWAELVSLGFSRSTYDGAKVLVLNPLT